MHIDELLHLIAFLLIQIKIRCDVTLGNQECVE